MICAVAVGPATETIESGLLGTMLGARLVGLFGSGPAALLDAAAQVGQPAADLFGGPGDLRTGQRRGLGGAGDQVGLRGPPGETGHRDAAGRGLADLLGAAPALVVRGRAPRGVPGAGLRLLALLRLLLTLLRGLGLRGLGGLSLRGLLRSLGLRGLGGRPCRPCGSDGWNSGAEVPGRRGWYVRGRASCPPSCGYHGCSAAPPDGPVGSAIGSGRACSWRTGSGRACS